MSIETWKEEFYPHRADSAEAHEQAVDHSLQKWTGLRPENLERHGLVQFGSDLFDVQDSDRLHYRFIIDSETCALCSVYLEKGARIKCKTCPLYKARGGVQCDDPRGDESCSPYRYGVQMAAPNPEPMIVWLLKTKEAQQ